MPLNMTELSNNLPDQSSQSHNFSAPHHEDILSQGGKASNQRRGSNVSLKGTSFPWRLKYKDFLPPGRHSDFLSTSDKAETFQKLVDIANEWLKKTPEAKVTSCETITWMSHDPRTLGDSEMMLLTKSAKENTSTYYVRGLRLWLVPSALQKSCYLSTCDVIPDGCDTIPDLFIKANKKFHGRSSKGQLVAVETVCVPVLRGSWNAQSTRWTEKVEDDCANVFIVRMFFVRESFHVQRRAGSLSVPSVKLDFKDIVPIMQEDETYEDYEVLVEKANVWLKENSGNMMRVVSMRSVMVQKHDGPHEEIGNSCNFLMPGINNPTLIEFFRILRITFLEKTYPQQQHSKHPQVPSRSEKQGLLESSMTSSLPQGQPLTSPLTFSFVTFTPELVWTKQTTVDLAEDATAAKVERVEKMRELFSKVMAHLRNSGAEFMDVETVFNPMQVYLDDSSVSHLFTDQEIKFLFTIRLYLTHQPAYLGDTRQIRRASFQPPSNQQQGGLDNEGTDVKPGNERRPLFLRNVVGRQYKYRWLVLAISAFTCMAIIVVVSVVYSNR